jgi:hypothetical protein
MNFFEKKAHFKEHVEEQSLSFRKKLFEYEGKYENEPKTKYDDENLN